MPEEKKGEKLGYVYDYSSGQFILTTPEDVKAREEWYAKYPGRPTFQDVTLGRKPSMVAALQGLLPYEIEGMVKTPLLPPTPLSLPVQQYLTDVAQLVADWRDKGYLNPDQAKAYFDQAANDIQQSGLTQRTFLSDEVTQWRARRQQRVLTPENLPERRRETAAENIATQKQQEVEQAPAMADYTSKKYAIISNPTMNFQQKDAALRELTTTLSNMGLTEYEIAQEYNVAKELAAQQLSQSEQAQMRGGGAELGEAQALGIPIEDFRLKKRGLLTPQEQMSADAEAEQKRKWDELKKFASMSRQRIATV